MAFNGLINSMQNMRSIGDYQKLEEEFQLKKAQAAQAQQLGDLQIQQAQAALQQPDIESLASRSLFEYHQGRPLSPEGKAAIETLATLKGSSVKYQPDEFGNVRAVSEPNPYQQFLGNSSTPSFGGDPMAASRAAVAQRQSEIGSNPYQGELYVMPLDLAGVEQALGANSPALKMGKSDVSNMAFDNNYAPSLDTEVMQSPYGRKQLFEDQLKTMQAQKQADITASGAGAETYAKKTAEVEAAKPKKMAAIERIKGNLTEAEKTFSTLPQGMIERGAEFVTGSVLGYPTPAGESLAKVDVLLPSLVSDIKQLVREPGEGTFTDRDQALIESMAFDPNAPLQSKMASYNTLKGVMQRYEESLGNRTMTTTGPGWGYLGVRE